jgi:hypothetical protein
VRAASLTLVPWGSARILEERCSVTYKWLFLLFGIWPVGHALEAAQTPAAHSVLAEENDAPMITLLRTVSAPVQFATVLRRGNLGTSSVHFGYLLGGEYKPKDSLVSLWPIQHVKTLIFSSQSLPLVRLWGGRLELDAFQTSLRIQYALLEPSGYGGMQDFRLPQQSFPGRPSAVHLAGLSVNFHFGRNWRPEHSLQGLRCLPRIVGAVLN